MDNDIELARRKERLIASIAVQRTRFADTIRELEGPIAIADRVVGAVHFLRVHPLFVAVLMVGVFVLRRRGMVGLVTRGLAAWRIWRSLATWRGRMGIVRGLARKS